MWTGILWAAAVCAGLGLLGSVVLVLASRHDRPQVGHLDAEEA